MVKKNKIVYVCDICGRERLEKLPKCPICKVDYCHDCEHFVAIKIVGAPTVFRYGSEGTITDSSFNSYTEKEEFHTLYLCSQCREPIEKEIKEKAKEIIDAYHRQA